MRNVLLLLVVGWVHIATATTATTTAIQLDWAKLEQLTPTPSRPPSWSSFLATFDVAIAFPNDPTVYTVVGNGTWAVDIEQRFDVVSIVSDNSHVAGSTLRRYDLATLWHVDATGSCTTEQLSDTQLARIRSPFAWINGATYEGSIVSETFIDDVWALQIGGSEHVVVYRRVASSSSSGGPLLVFEHLSSSTSSSLSSSIVYRFLSWYQHHEATTQRLTHHATITIPSPNCAATSSELPQGVFSGDTSVVSGGTGVGFGLVGGCPNCDAEVSGCIAQRHSLSQWCNCWVSWNAACGCVGRFCCHD